MNLDNFLQKISYSFSDQKLLDEALTHPSLSKENKGRPNYQRLEFLGDKVLSLVISEFLIKKYPDESEGDLSKRHAALVSGEFLSNLALEIGIMDVLQVSFGEKKLGGKTNKRNLENALEALIGGIYLDSNYDNVRNFILRIWHDYLEKNITPPKDPVSHLQEIVQLRTKQLPEYFIDKCGGLDHSPSFVAKLKIPVENLEFEAFGKSKKEAQREVAKIALEFLVMKK